jgi:hypothetical protein
MELRSAQAAGGFRVAVLPLLELPELPELELPELELPELELPEVELPELELPERAVPELPELPELPEDLVAVRPDEPEDVDAPAELLPPDL